MQEDPFAGRHKPNRRRETSDGRALPARDGEACGCRPDETDPHRYNLDSVMDAYRAIEQRRAVGKVVIDIADSKVLRRSSLR
jgi:hypothetical protein